MSDPAGGLFDGMFGMPPDWLAALLDVSAALVVAKAALGRIPWQSAKLIVEHCRPDLFDAADIGRRTAAHATPVVPLVEDLRALLPADVAQAVHTPATSQDIIDSALMLLAARAIDGVTADLDVCASALLHLAAQHQNTELAGRTLLARALPTTFGRLVDTWLAGLTDARAAVDRVRRDSLAVQLGGPVGTLDDPALVSAFAAELGLLVPANCWHTNRIRIAELAAALGMVTGALGKVAGDVVLLAQAELGELGEGTPGGSSAMPNKRNSARSVQILACAHRVPGLVGTVFAALPQELQRAAGRWQAEWQTVGDLLALTGAAARHGRVLLTELKVDTERMHDDLA
ncbi:MAG TPA: lyase family protein [Pseudonocardiaceae bacterium]|nr:lyase family protein [Pseudonocardiaceae bacterium]